MKFQKGDKVKISDDGLITHSRSTPASVGYAQCTINWRESLRRIHNADLIGTVERTFPNSTHLNVVFNGLCYGVDEYMVVKHTNKKE